MGLAPLGAKDNHMAGQSRIGWDAVHPAQRGTDQDTVGRIGPIALPGRDVDGRLAQKFASDTPDQPYAIAAHTAQGREEDIRRSDPAPRNVQRARVR